MAQFVMSAGQRPRSRRPGGGRAAAAAEEQQGRNLGQQQESHEPGRARAELPKKAVAVYVRDILYEAALDDDHGVDHGSWT